jgi:hypothetical protein
MPQTLAAPPASPYVQRLLGRLGDADPFAAQEAFPGALARAVAGLSEGELRSPEAPGKWSVIEVVQHLADTELVHGFRFRMVLAHDEPPLAGYDQDLWAAGLGYRDGDLEEALAQLRALRHANLRLLRPLPLAAWERVGIHGERGPESLRTMFRMLAGHDLVHLDQVARIRRAIGAPPVAGGAA